ncbi:ATP-binding cassette domain-containing protein [Variovorax paradoxus]|uniref:ABC transporter ATP-binding protein n=1 Tax=Variovorax paradoxus TaxID=34073 RepID=UPI003ED15F6D
MNPSQLVRVAGLNKSYPTRRGRLPVLRDLSFDIAVGRSLAIVGESGSGKTTAAMCLARLTEPDSGAVLLDGQDLITAPSSALRHLRRCFGVVMQNPLTSLDPRMALWQSVAEPLHVHEPGLPAAERKRRAIGWIERVGLSATQAHSLPHQLSGGQLQRVVIARALILQPKLVILDEPTSALDVSIQAQVLNLLCDLRDELGLSYLFITHNLSLVEILADDVLVMFAGAAVERGPVDEVFARPRHPYTRELLAAIPGVDPRVRNYFEVTDRLPRPVAAATGCAYAPRCERAQPRCSNERPEVASEPSPVSCFFV